MDKKTLDSLTVKKRKSDSTVLSVRIQKKTLDALKKKDIDLAKTVQNLLERLAE